MVAEAHRPMLDPTVASLRARLRRVSEVPALFRLERCVTVHEADEIIALGRQVERGVLALDHAHDSTGFSVELSTKRFAAVGQVQRRIAALIGVPWHVEPSMRFRRYLPGEAHPPHVDNYQLGGLDLLVTAMVVLQAPTAGGQTTFPLAKGPEAGPIAVTPRDRELIVWLNHRVDATPEPASKHVAEAVSTGEKCTLTNFMYLPSALAAGPVHAILDAAAKGAP